jgi:membrane-associated phospholipid phosphatase
MKWLDRLPLHTKHAWLLLGTAYFFGGYFLVAALNIHWALDCKPWLPGEAALPFLPQAIWAYLLPYPVILASYWAIADQDRFIAFVHHGLVLLTLCFLSFLVFPVTMNRPPAPLDATLTAQLVRIYFALDPPRNIFPSIHVALPLLITVHTWPVRRRARWIFALATALIAVAVIFIKQHYVVDVMGAVVIVWFVRTKFPTGR